MKKLIRLSLALLGIGMAVIFGLLAVASYTYLDSLMMTLGAVMALSTGIIGAMELND